MEQSQLGKGLNLGRPKQVIPLGEPGWGSSSSCGHCWCLFKQGPQSSPDLWPQPLYHRSPLHTHQESTRTLWSSSNTGQGWKNLRRRLAVREKRSLQLRLHQREAAATCRGNTTSDLCLCRGPPCLSTPYLPREREKSRLKTQPAWPDPQVSAPATRHQTPPWARRWWSQSRERLCLAPAPAPPRPVSSSAKMTAASISWRMMWWEPTRSPALLPKALEHAVCRGMISLQRDDQT